MKYIKKILFVFFTIFIPVVFAGQYSPEVRQRIQDIQEQMRKELAEGNIESIRSELEKASGNFHAVEIELGLIQTFMQAGDYKHALSAAAHTLAEHPETVDSTLFYAWLLAIGGQTVPALNLVEAALKLHPDNNSLSLLHNQIKTKKLISTDIKTSKDFQLKPFTWRKSAVALTGGHLVSEILASQVLASGVVVDKGRSVLTTFSNIENIKKLHVVNGLGQTVSVSKYKILSNRLVLLTLDEPIKSRSVTGVVDKRPFPGTPVYIIGMSSLNANQPEWPQLRLNILGTPASETANEYPIHVKDAAAGSGVYNQTGSLIGIVAVTIVAGAETKVMLPVSANDVSEEEKLSRTLPTQKMAMDEIYERGLGNTVQVLAADGIQ